VSSIPKGQFESELKLKKFKSSKTKLEQESPY